MTKAESMQRRAAGLPWNVEELRLIIADMGNTLDEWDTLLGDAPTGTEAEFKIVINDLNSRLSRLSFSLAEHGVEAS